MCSTLFAKIYSFNCNDEKPPFSIQWFQEADKTLSQYIIGPSGSVSKNKSKSIKKVNESQFKVIYESGDFEDVIFSKTQVNIINLNIDGTYLVKDTFLKDGSGPIILQQCNSNSPAFKWTTNLVTSSLKPAQEKAVTKPNDKPSDALVQITKEVQRNADLLDEASSKKDFAGECKYGKNILNIVEKNKNIVGNDYYNNVLNLIKSRTHDSCVLADSNTPAILDEIKRNCGVYSKAKDKCAVAADFNKCVDIVAPGVRNMPLDMCGLLK